MNNWIEFGVPCPEPGHGWVSLEENALVTEQGVEWLSRRQQATRVLRSS